MSIAQFHEGQDVEVHALEWPKRQTRYREWRKAKIIGISRGPDDPALNEGDYAVQYTDGTRSVFDAEHIRAARQHTSLEDIGFELPGERL